MKLFRSIKTNKKILGTSISERPIEINDRIEFGHWEIDTILGIKSSSHKVLLTLVKRKTRYTIVICILSKTTLAVIQTINNRSYEYGEEFSQIY